MKIIIIPIILFLFACKTKDNTRKTDTPITYIPVFNATGPPLLVYKTKGNYNNLVPVFLSEDNGEIVSYPHPKDLISGNKLQMPVVLPKGYLLDQRGIGLNIAFLKMSYEEYSELKEPPSITELNNMIIDREPLEELCNCGVKTSEKDWIQILTHLINENKIRTTCKIIK